MGQEKPKLPLLEQREIEARIVGPLVRAFEKEIGEERTLAIVAEVIRGLARESGADLARLLGEQTLEAFAQSLDRWRENGALELDLLEQSPTRLAFNVTRCRYAEMYRALGLADLGASLSCQRDLHAGPGIQSRDRTDPDPDHHGRRLVLRFPVSPRESSEPRSDDGEAWRAAIGRSGRGGSDREPDVSLSRLTEPGP